MKLRQLLTNASCIPRLNLGILCICHPYDTTMAATAESSCVRSLPQYFVHSFSHSGHMSPVPRSRCQWIWGAVPFHLWPLGGQMQFSCALNKDQSFQPIFFIFTPNMHWTNSFVSCVHCNPQSCQLIFFQILTTHSLDQGLDAHQFSVLCSSSFGH